MIYAFSKIFQILKFIFIGNGRPIEGYYVNAKNAVLI